MLVLHSIEAALLLICLPANQPFVKVATHCVFVRVSLPLRFHYELPDGI